MRTRTRRWWMAAMVLGLTAGASGTASANITYELSGVTLEFNGEYAGELTGSFTTDDAITTLIAAEILAPAARLNQGIEFTAFTYTFGAPSGNASDGSQISLGYLRLTDNLEGRDLILIFPGGLTPDGAALSIGGGSEEGQLIGAGYREVTGGGAVVASAAVPEPSSVAMLAVGSLGLIGLGWRRGRMGA